MLGVLEFTKVGFHSCPRWQQQNTIHRVYQHEGLDSPWIWGSLPCDPGVLFRVIQSCFSYCWECWPFFVTSCQCSRRYVTICDLHSVFLSRRLSLHLIKLDTSPFSNMNRLDFFRLWEFRVNTLLAKNASTLRRCFDTYFSSSLFLGGSEITAGYRRVSNRNRLDFFRLWAYTTREKCDYFTVIWHCFLPQSLPWWSYQPLRYLANPEISDSPCWS